MSDIHRLIPDEATIKIVSPSTDLYQSAPPQLQKPYWVTLGPGEQCDGAFDTLEEAVAFVTREAVNAKRK